MEEKLKEIASELLAIANEMENAPQVQAEEQAKSEIDIATGKFQISSAAYLEPITIIHIRFPSDC